MTTTRNSWTSASSNLALCIVLAWCAPALAQPALFPPPAGPVARSDQDGAEGSRTGDEPIQVSSETLQNSLKLVMPRRMVNSKTLTLRASIVDVGGGVVTSGCYATLGTVAMNRVSDGASIPITVTFFDDHLPVPADSIRFFHGVGSVSFTLDDGDAVPAGDYRVTVTVGTMSASRIVTVLAHPTWRELQGTLSGADLVWGPSENIHIVGHDTYVPAGSTLTIHPGTLVMVDSLGALENGTLITVNGQLDAVGSQDDPVHFFSASGAAAMIHTVSGSLSNVDAWRGIHHYGSGSSSYRWVILTGAGNGPIQGHPRPAIIQLHDTHNVLVENSILTDSTGMMFQGFGTGSYTVRKSLVSRVGIGCEFTGSGHTLLIEDTWWTSIGRGPSTPQRFDGDMLHVDGPASNQTIRRCIIADGGDDGIDHSGSTFTVENTIIHTIEDKAISMTGGFVTLRNVLIHTTGTGVVGTGSAYNSTFASGRIDSPQTVQESIFWPPTVGACSADIDYTDGGDAAHIGCGTGNISADPRFTDTSQCDYSPQAGSTALTAGPGGTRIGWLGFPVGATCATAGDCEDDNPCTLDDCESRLCAFTPIADCAPSCAIDADCSNGLYCDGIERCTNERCEPGVVPACDDGLPCTVDSCSNATDRCQHIPSSAPCDDGDACTIDETCSSGTCVGTALPAPIEVQGLLVSGHVSTTLSWTGQGASVVFDVIGGSLGDLRTQQGVTSATCLRNDVGSVTWADPRQIPGTGTGYYYVVRAQDACSAGTYGYASSAAERLLAAGCP